jgi:hypothetical protein
MKLSCSLGLIALVSGALACSSDGGTPRPTGGSGGTAGQTGSAGSAGSATTSTAGSGGGTGTAGSSSGSAGTSGGTTVPTGDAFTIDSTGATVDGLGSVADTAYGINGGAQVIRSKLGTTATPVPTDGKLCMKGTTSPETVNGTPDYTNYWGGLIQADLNYGANPNAGGADAGSDAGGDAGTTQDVPMSVALGWDPTAHNIKGFQFKVTGATVPASFRFQVTPDGSDPNNDHFCANLSPVDGSTENVYFTDIQRDCYNTPPGSSVFTDAKGYTKLLNIQWQISANETIPIAFDFCVSDIKPILGN